MRSRGVWAVAAVLVAMGASGFAQTTAFDSDSCTANRGVVRSGAVGGSTPGNPAAAKVITLDDFAKIKYVNAADPKRWPSKIAPSSRTTGEGIIYRIDNLELRGEANCHDAIQIDLGAFGGFNTQPEIAGLFPSSACLKGTLKDVVDAARAVYTDQLSVWGANLWATDFEKSCGGDGGDFTSNQRVSVVGYSYWDDSGGLVTPVLRLAPVIAIINTSDGVGDGSGGTGGTGGSGGTSSSVLAVVLPDDVIANHVIMSNAGATDVLFSTVGTTTSDVTVSAQTDSDDLLVSLNKSTIPAPGNAGITATIHTTATTAARDHVVTITATDGTNTSSASFIVTVICDPPLILGIDQPKNVTVGLGRPANLSVKVSGSGPLTYQWFSGAKGLVNFPLAIGSSPNFTTSALNDTTSYWVRVTNPCGSVDSQTVTVSVAASAKPTSSPRH